MFVSLPDGDHLCSVDRADRGRNLFSRVSLSRDRSAIHPAASHHVVFYYDYGSKKETRHNNNCIKNLCHRFWNMQPITSIFIIDRTIKFNGIESITATGHSSRVGWFY